MLQFGTGKPQVTSTKAHGPSQSQNIDHIDSVQDGKQSSQENSPPPSVVAIPHSPPEVRSPPAEESVAVSKNISSRNSRSASPARGSRVSSRTASPVSFGYPYHQPMNNAFFGDTHTPTAIPG